MSSGKVDSGAAQLLALANLITSAVQTVISEYKAAGASIPPLDSTVNGVFDTPEAVTPNLSKAIRTIEAACAQLSFSVASPGHVITNYEEPACMLVVTEANIADILADKPEGLHIDEIAKQTGLDAGKLGRILRMLATKHCFREVDVRGTVKPNVFANNRLSIQLMSTNPVSGLVGHMSDESFKAGSFLNETLTDPIKGSSSLADDSPFQRAHGHSPFVFYTTPKGKLISDRFGKAMTGWGEVTGRSMLPQVYPWDKIPAGSVLCDVGGSSGHASLALYWSKELPEAVKTEQIRFVPLDFFKDSPEKDCDFYYLRHVLHDWPNSECLKILENVRKSMAQGSRLLIRKCFSSSISSSVRRKLTFICSDEFVLQHAVRDISGTTTIDQAPEPLLANYGMGRVRLYEQDLNMMILMNSKERTLQEFINLANQTGFKFEHLWDSGEAGLIEFSVV
ncbi:S-adenosyl-L-methionine-dependent methyltransferase [Cyathus striatus]|nr:S-adenosyl-L-methionine-dependent methyltransferase [Cyathus striatus]